MLLDPHFDDKVYHRFAMEYLEVVLELHGFVVHMGLAGMVPVDRVLVDKAPVDKAPVDRILVDRFLMDMAGQLFELVPAEQQSECVLVRNFLAHLEFDLE